MLVFLNSILPFIIIIVLIAVLIVLLIGIISMLKGGEFNKKWGNKLMRARVALQGLAIILILLTAYLFTG
ncbi:twin transmembrane helix small protein [Alphaproteobacteria bacterium]|nr:twin transmembrane helix small protein [Alphaproteobacteria bacterium]